MFRDDDNDCSKHFNRAELAQTKESLSVCVCV